MGCCGVRAGWQRQEALDQGRDGPGKSWLLIPALIHGKMKEKLMGDSINKELKDRTLINASTHGFMENNALSNKPGARLCCLASRGSRMLQEPRFAGPGSKLRVSWPPNPL